MGLKGHVFSAQKSLSYQCLKLKKALERLYENQTCESPKCLIAIALMRPVCSYRVQANAKFIYMQMNLHPVDALRSLHPCYPCKWGLLRLFTWNFYHAVDLAQPKLDPQRSRLRFGLLKRIRTLQHSRHMLSTYF